MPRGLESRGWAARIAARGYAAFGRASLLALADQAIYSAASFATNVIVARASSRQDFGIYFLALSLLFFVRGIQEQLISAPYTIYSQRRRGRADLAVYTGSVFIHQVALSALTLVAILVFAGVCGRVLGPQHELVAALRVLAVVTPFFLFREHLRKLAFASFKFRQAIFADTVVSVLQVSGVFLLWRYQLLTPVTAYLTIAIVCGVVSVLWISRRPFPLRLVRGNPLPAWFENWKFGRWALATFVIGSNTPHLMPWIVAALKDETTAALLGAAQTLVGVGNMFVTGMHNFLNPRTVRAYTTGGPDALWRTLLQANLVFLLVLGTLCVVFVACGEWLPALLFGADYEGLWGTLVLLSLTVLVGGFGLAAGNGLWAMDRPSANVVADACVFVTTVAGAWILIPTHGVLGAAWAWFVGKTLGVSLRWVALLLVLSRRRKLQDGRESSGVRLR